mmetsp:Transcript_96979/g.172617  ORF Transcript_96979/g.172617 Transcript_96979/m.172617 type:complete len:480 (+) Transcript_96979:48-1487(+)
MAMASKKYSIVLVGITGEGKSSTGNTLCGHSAFSVSDSCDSVTRACEHVDFAASGLSYRVVDTVGMSDTELSQQEVMQRFATFANMTKGEINVFLFVVRDGRFRPDHAEALQAFSNNCGPEALKNTILVLTHCRCGQKQLMAKLDASSNEQLKRWQSRVLAVVGIDNMEPARARPQLLSSIARARPQLRQPYTNTLLAAARDKFAKAHNSSQQLICPHRRAELGKAIASIYDGRSSFEDFYAKLSELLQQQQAEKERERGRQEQLRQQEEAIRRVQAERDQEAQRRRHAEAKAAAAAEAAAEIQRLQTEKKAQEEHAQRQEERRIAAEEELRRAREAKRAAEEWNSTRNKRARLCERLKRLALPAKGTTDQLQKELKDNGLTVVELKKELRSRDLVQSGSKEELEKRVGDARRKESCQQAVPTPARASPWQYPRAAQASPRQHPPAVRASFWQQPPVAQASPWQLPAPIEDVTDSDAES